MLGKEVVATKGAPAAAGPYSQGVKAGGFLFVSGQLPIDPETGEMLVGTLKSQTRQALLNIKAVAEAAGATLADVVKTTVYFRDLEDFTEVNEAYAQFFGEEPPARAAVEAARLPRDAGIEIEAVVKLPDP